MTGTEHKFGFVALIGAPNVGKSTLLNKLVGQKISIISRRPQTTRHRVVGIRTEPQYQIAFVDTPGLHSDQKKSLNRVINRTAISSMSDVDVILFLIDYRGWNGKLRAVFQHASTRNTPIILLINKIDKLTDKSQLLPHNVVQRPSLGAPYSSSNGGKWEIDDLHSTLSDYFTESHVPVQDGYSMPPG